MQVLQRLDRVIAALETREKEMQFKQLRAPYADKFGRGHYSGWVAATQADLYLLRAMRDEAQEAAEAEQAHADYVDRMLDEEKSA